MKFFNYQIDVKIGKNLVFKIPDDAFQISVVNTDGFKIKYYVKNVYHFIDLPKCKTAEITYISPRLSILGTERIVLTNRVVKTLIYF